MNRLIAVLLVLVVGCNATTNTRDDNPAKPDTKAVEVFNVAVAADALAHQAELANESPIFKASEVLDAILNQGEACGMPVEFVAAVRKACPAIGGPPGDLSDDQVKAIRGVR